MEQDRIKLYQGMVNDGDYTKDIDTFTAQYFSKESTVNDLWKKLLQNGDYTKTKKDFYVKYACDLSWAKETIYCGGSGGGNTTTYSWDNFPCVVELAKTKGVSINKDNSYLIDDFKYYPNGRKGNVKTKERFNYTCDDLEFKKSNDNVDTSSSDEHIELNGIYRTKGDPYQYKIIDCVWYTKGKSITNWKSLEDNQTANDLLDARFPNARKNCKNNKPEEVLKPIIPNFDDEFEDVDDAEEANDIINN